LQDLTHRRINKLLTTKDHLFLDPLTDAVWQYPQIPRSAYPEMANEEVAKKVQRDRSRLEKFRSFVRADRGEKEIVWSESAAQQYWQDKLASSNGLVNAELNAARAELDAQRMRSQATRNAHVERRIDPRTHTQYNYMSGNY
jgi:thymidine phosphorylase